MRGVLDEFSLQEIQSFTYQDDEEVLATLSREMIPITIPAREVYSRMQSKIDDLEKSDVDVIIVVCTGKFPDLQSRAPLILPSEALALNVAAIARGKTVSVFVLLPQQVEQLRKKWQAVGVEPIIYTVSPFSHKSKSYFYEISKKLEEDGSLFIVMDCMGYDSSMKQIVSEVSGKLVITARTLLSKVISELAE